MEKLKTWGLTILSLIIIMIFAVPAYADSTFSDIKGHWAENTINWSVNNSDGTND